MSNQTEKSGFERVREYLVACPHVPSNHPALQGALEGLDKAQERMERDAKLQKKFAAAKKKTKTSADEGIVVVEAAAARNKASRKEDAIIDDDEIMEWQDVAKKKEEPLDDTSYLGTQLAGVVVKSLSQHSVQVPSPLAAITVALHAALLSLEFVCTGMPEEVPRGGFAPPVRALTQFLPPNCWDSSDTIVSFRYRKNGTGAILLTVQLEEANTIAVQLHPANQKEPSTQSLQFPLTDHINLDSWNAARKQNSNVAPSLHYKALATLLTNFGRNFDLGAVRETNIPKAEAYVDNTVIKSVEPSTFVPAAAQQPSTFAPMPPTQWKEGRVPSNISGAFPVGLHPRGDFAGDLGPGGLRDPRVLFGEGRMEGNLMGPNHPLFTGGIGGGPPGGPGGMQPRFDPVYPPGIDPDQAHPPTKLRPSRTGEPNPDHLPPPNSFDMFS